MVTYGSVSNLWCYHYFSEQKVDKAAKVPGGTTRRMIEDKAVKREYAMRVLQILSRAYKRDYTLDTVLVRLQPQRLDLVALSRIDTPQEILACMNALQKQHLSKLEREMQLFCYEQQLALQGYSVQLINEIYCLSSDYVMSR